jgi:hypothetical protein
MVALPRRLVESHLLCVIYIVGMWQPDDRYLQRPSVPLLRDLVKDWRKAWSPKVGAVLTRRGSGRCEKR